MISVLITSKQELYLGQTIEDIKRNATNEVEILAKEDDGRGQRAMLNMLADKAKGDILMKSDAHCSFGPGWDEEMLSLFEDNMIMAPWLMPLDATNWIVSHHNKMSQFVFDTNLVMHHAEEQKTWPITETMCLQGSCFMLTKENWFKWNVCDESVGSWGHQGTELGIKAWTNGGRCVTNKKTYYGHLFRHDEADFPYQRNQEEIDTTHKLFLDKYKNKSIGWLVKRFNYPLDWTVEKVTKLHHAH